MKIPGVFADSLRKVYNRLGRQFGKLKGEDLELTDPVDQLVLSILATDGSSRRAKTAIKGVLTEMVDLNEVRVTPIAELQEMLEKHTREPHAMAFAVIRSLNWICTKFDTLHLEGLREHQHAVLRSVFEKIPDCPDHARRAMLLMSFGIPTFPLDQQMLAYLIKNEAVPEDVALEEAVAFVERQLRASEIRQFYVHVKRASEGTRRAVKRSTKKATKKATKKTTKKSKTKRKVKKKRS